MIQADGVSSLLKVFVGWAENHHLGTDAWNNPADWLGWNYLPLNSINSSHAGNYKCVATSSFGSATSDEITVNVTSPPHITKQPEDISVVKTARPSQLKRPEPV